MRKRPIRLHLGCFSEGRKPQKSKAKNSKKEEKKPRKTKNQNSRQNRPKRAENNR